jgi:hypothetical protein
MYINIIIYSICIFIIIPFGNTTSVKDECLLKYDYVWCIYEKHNNTNEKCIKYHPCEKKYNNTLNKKCNIDFFISPYYHHCTNNKNKLGAIIIVSILSIVICLGIILFCICDRDDYRKRDNYLILP